MKRAAKHPSRAYPYSANADACFRLGPEGLSPCPAAPGSPSQGTAGPPAPALAALAPRVAAIAARRGTPGRAALALNRYGYALLETSPDGSSYRLDSHPLAETSGLSVANLWPRPSGFLLELYRDPFATAPSAGLSSGRELFALGEDGSAARLPRLGEGDEELFALQPASERWYAELRAEAAGKARLRYLSLESPDSGADQSTMRDIRKADFERALEPRAIGGAPEALRSAAEALAPGAVLIRARDGAGMDCYWLSGGDLEDAREASAWLSDEGSSVLVVERSGGAAYVSGGSRRPFSIAPPATGAVLTTAALLPLGTKSLALIAWETGSFPSVESSGLLVLSVTNLMK